MALLNSVVSVGGNSIDKTLWYLLGLGFKCNSILLKMFHSIYKSYSLQLKNINQTTGSNTKKDKQVYIYTLLSMSSIIK